jgi:hypothetical protein
LAGAGSALAVGAGFGANGAGVGFGAISSCVVQADKAHDNEIAATPLIIAELFIFFLPLIRL